MYNKLHSWIVDICALVAAFSVVAIYKTVGVYKILAGVILSLMFVVMLAVYLYNFYLIKKESPNI